MTSSDKPTAEDRRFLESQGMVEIEPGRWIGAPDFQLPEASATELRGLSVFVAVKASSAGAFEALDAGALEDGMSRAMDQYPNMLPPDLVAVTLRKLDIKCKAVETDPAGTNEPDPRSHPGFRAALIHFPGARRVWLD